MINETTMQSAVILSHVQIDLSKTEDQVIELTEMGQEFLIEKIIITNPSVCPVVATGAQIFNGVEKTGMLLFNSIDQIAQYDYLNSLLAETNYCVLKVPTDGFPVVNNSHIVKTNKLYFSVHTPQKNAKADLYVLGYILK